MLITILNTGVMEVYFPTRCLTFYIAKVRDNKRTELTINIGVGARSHFHTFTIKGK